METIYLCIVIFLLCLAVFDLFVGVSNDAVNFLQSAVGARVASFRTILIIASVGVMLGAVMSSGMMDVARHGIMMPAHYSFHEVMTIMLAVMVTDIIVLDAFNTLGMPTSTTVSLVFELLGGTAMLALLKVMGDPTLEYADLLLHVIDVSNPEWQHQAEVVEKLIVELGANEIPRIDVFNKCDRVEAGDLRPHGADICSISARTGEGVDRLLEMIDRRLDKGTRRGTIHLPYDKGGLLDMLYREAKVESVEYSETIDIVAVCPPKVLGQIGDYTPDWTPPKEDWE